MIIRSKVLNSRNLNLIKRNYSQNIEYSTRALWCYRIIVPIEGEHEIKVGEKVFKVVPGQAIFLPGGIKNITYRHFGENKKIYYNMAFRYFPNFNSYDFPPQVVNISEDILQLLEEIPISCNEITKDSCQLNWTFYRFLHHFQNLISPTTDKKYLKIKPALEYIREHNNYSAEQLADLCGLSRSRFHIVFKEVTGSTFIEEKHRIQALKAEYLLSSTNISIAEIAKIVGFDSVRYFRQVFKKRYGSKLPGRIRRLNKKV